MEVSMIATDALQLIPSVGPSIAADLRSLGYRQVEDLRDESPEEMFQALCELRGEKIDRCVLYTFRCAVYFASNDQHEPQLLKWWNWKD
jgi:hypothetical protein